MALPDVQVHLEGMTNASIATAQKILKIKITAMYDSYSFQMEDFEHI